MHKSNAVCFILHRMCEKGNSWVLARTEAAGKIVTGLQLVVMLGVPIGSAHKSVALSLPPCNIILFLYQTVHVNLSKCTSHPTSVKTRMPKSKAIESSGMMWPVNVTGRPSMCMSNIWVGGPLEKSSIFFLLQRSCLVLDHVYVCYMTSHVKFC
jgi:hypothetical protein